LKQDVKKLLKTYKILLIAAMRILPCSCTHIYGLSLATTYVFIAKRFWKV